MSITTLPASRIRDAHDALFHLATLLERSVPVEEAPTGQKLYLSTEYLAPDFVATLVRRVGPEAIRIDTAGMACCSLPIVLVAQHIVDTLPPVSPEVDPADVRGTPLYWHPVLREALRRHHLLHRIAQANVEREDQAVPDTTPVPLAPVPRLLRKDEHPLYDLVEATRIRDALKSGDCGRSTDARRRALDRLLKKPGQILRRVKVSDFKALDRLALDFPHFRNVIERMRVQLRLQQATRGALVFRPLLMVGPPGVGKTAFMRRLGSLLDQFLIPVASGSITGSMVLKGGHSSWSGGRMGRIADSLLRLKDGQGLLLQLDEIDKLREQSGTRSYPVEPVLLDLLEPEQNEVFEDEYLQVQLNLRPLLSVIATANRLESISAPLLSRFEVEEIALPTDAQMPAVLRSIDRSLRQEQPGLAKVFRPLDDEVVSALRQVSARDARGVLLGAYGRALEKSVRGRRRLTRDDIAQARAGLRSASPTASSRPETEELLVVLRLPTPPTGGAPPGTALH